MYTFKIDSYTYRVLDLAHTRELQTMIGRLNAAYDECDARREFYLCYFLLGTFRDIIMTWPCNMFSAAYEELSRWQEFFGLGDDPAGVYEWR